MAVHFAHGLKVFRLGPPMGLGLGGLPIRFRVGGDATARARQVRRRRFSLEIQIVDPTCNLEGLPELDDKVVWDVGVANARNNVDLQRVEQCEVELFLLCLGFKTHCLYRRTN